MTNRQVAPSDGDRIDTLAILELADEMIQGFLHEVTYVFHTPVATVRLYIYTLDSDTQISVYIPGQPEPLLALDLVGCQKISVIRDKRGTALEFAGQFKLAGHFDRGHEPYTGFRMWLRPFVTFEPFLI